MLPRWAVIVVGGVAVSGCGNVAAAVGTRTAAGDEQIRRSDQGSGLPADDHADAEDRDRAQ